jgi:hypothetical protein
MRDMNEDREMEQFLRAYDTLTVTIDDAVIRRQKVANELRRLKLDISKLREPVRCGVVSAKGVGCDLLLGHERARHVSYQLPGTRTWGDGE